jgi:endonuclease III
LAAVVDEANIPTLVALAIAREQGESANVREVPTNHEAIVKIHVEQLPAELDRRQAVVQTLLEYRSRQQIGGPFTRDKNADEFLRRNPFAFLMAASIDRGALAEAVWQIPFLLKDKLGHLDPRLLSQMSEDELEGTLRQLDRQPRFPRQSARTIVSLAKLVTNKFDGDGACVWQGQEPRDVIETLQEIWGVGPGIAHMAVRILIDEFGYHPGLRSLRTIDVKPDTHVVRVFHKTGLTNIRSGKACVEAARQLHPKFPGLLDWPAWEIGRNWCHEHNPDCVTCPLCRVCLRISTLQK